MIIKKKIKDCLINELKYLIRRCEYKQIYPEYYYVCKWLIKVNKDHILYRKFGNNKTTKIFNDVLKVFNQEIINQEIEVLENE